MNLVRQVTISLRLARVTIEVPYQPLPIHQSDVRYVHGPDSAAQPGVPAGETIEFDWNVSAIPRDLPEVLGPHTHALHPFQAGIAHGVPGRMVVPGVLWQ